MCTNMQNFTKEISETKHQMKSAVSAKCQICKGLLGFFVKKRFANGFIPKRLILLEGKKDLGEITPPDLTISLHVPNF